jgi:glycosyltransferase involved in cell wall biosynthesis
MFPFVLLGKLAGRLFPLKTKHTVFLFFPSADIGGSIKVNADITNCIKDQRPLIIFSKKPKNNQFRHLFEIEGVRIIDLHKYIDNKWFHFVNIFFRGVLTSWINKAEKPVVFGGEGLYFYKVIPHLKKESKKIELCHLNTWFNFSQAFINYIDYRIFSTPKIKRDVEKQYLQNNLPQKFFDKLLFIDNKVEILPYQEIVNPVLEVIYVGRGAPQKRVHLIAEIARQMKENNSPIHFSFVGDVEKIVPETTQQYCTLYGNVNDEQLLNKIYQQSDVLLLTSAYEGLPIAVMEMMAKGKVIISTAVDGIPDYITHKENGLLITETTEDKIIECGISLLDLLINNPELKKTIGSNSYSYAIKHFSGETFCGTYRKILQNDK